MGDTTAGARHRRLRVRRRRLGRQHGTSIPNPIGNVGHRGRWVLTVAASTHDGISGLVSAAGPGTPPAGTQNLLATRGSGSPVSPALLGHPIRHFTGQNPTQEGCTPGEEGVSPSANPFPAGLFNGAATLIQRGSCAFTEIRTRSPPVPTSC